MWGSERYDTSQYFNCCAYRWSGLSNWNLSAEPNFRPKIGTRQQRQDLPFFLSRLLACECSSSEEMPQNERESLWRSLKM
jgi:hypothetical protein